MAMIRITQGDGRWGAAAVGAVAAVFWLSAGCGAEFGQERANRYREQGSGGEALVRDDLAAIVEDATLTDDEKRRLLREAGLRDEDLIDALISRD